VSGLPGAHRGRRSSGGAGRSLRCRWGCRRHRRRRWLILRERPGAGQRRAGRAVPEACFVTGELRRPGARARTDPACRGARRLPARRPRGAVSSPANLPTGPARAPDRAPLPVTAPLASAAAPRSRFNLPTNPLKPRTDPAPGVRGAEPFRHRRKPHRPRWRPRQATVRRGAAAPGARPDARRRVRVPRGRFVTGDKAHTHNGPGAAPGFLTPARRRRGPAEPLRHRRNANTRAGPAPAFPEPATAVRSRGAVCVTAETSAHELGARSYVSEASTPGPSDERLRGRLSARSTSSSVASGPTSATRRRASFRCTSPMARHDGSARHRPGPRHGHARRRPSPPADLSGRLPRHRRPGRRQSPTAPVPRPITRLGRAAAHAAPYSRAAWPCSRDPRQGLGGFRDLVTQLTPI
jgi:hypothetical protein